jgi:hypothetical protein
MGRFEFGMWEALVDWLLRVRRGPVAVLTVATALLLVPASASATSPVLEFAVPGNHLPVSFKTTSGPVTAEMANFANLVHCTASQGEGEITGPRSTVSKYTFTGCVTEGGSNKKCHSSGANEEEIKTGPIDAELVYIHQAKHEVAMLLNPGGGTYIAFECGGESAEGSGRFLAPGSPVNREASVFTVKLEQSGSLQTPDEYEGASGEELKAIPMGEHGGGQLVTTGVQATFTVHTSVPVDVRAISSEEVEAKEHEEEAAAMKLQEEEAAATKKRQEEAAATKQREEEAAAKKRQEEEAATKKLKEEEAATAAAKKRQEEEAAASHEREEEAIARKRLEAETLEALRGAISRALARSGAHPKIDALLEHGRLAETFTAPESGVLVIQWWWVPPGAHLAKKSRRNPVLVAQGSAVFSAAGTSKIDVSLTSAGRRLLAAAKNLKLTARVQFTPTAHAPISATTKLSLKR